MAQIAVKIEDRGVDEIYIDLSEHAAPSDTLARQIKQAVYDATGLTFDRHRVQQTAGQNRIRIDKPDGITILRDDEIQTRIWPMPASKIMVSVPRRQSGWPLGIHTIADLAGAARAASTAFRFALRVG